MGRRIGLLTPLTPWTCILAGYPGLRANVAEQKLPELSQIAIQSTV